MESPCSNVVSGFTKLFSTIVHSTVWREEKHVKIVWVTMLAMANRNGCVYASVPGLASAANVTLEECVNALENLSSPDKWSRTKTNEGRRIQECDGGWELLNYLKYREMRDDDERRIQTRFAVAKHRQQKKAESLTVSHGKPEKAQAEAEAEAEERTHTSENKTPRLAFGGKALKLPRFLHEEFDRLLGQRRDDFDLLTWYPIVDAEVFTSGEAVPDELAYWRLRFRRECERLGIGRKMLSTRRQPEAAPYFEPKPWECRIHEPTCETTQRHCEIMAAEQGGVWQFNVQSQQCERVKP